MLYNCWAMLSLTYLNCFYFNMWHKDTAETSTDKNLTIPRCACGYHKPSITHF